MRTSKAFVLLGFGIAIVLYTQLSYHEHVTRTGSGLSKASMLLVESVQPADTAQRDADHRFALLEKKLEQLTASLEALRADSSRAERKNGVAKTNAILEAVLGTVTPSDRLQASKTQANPTATVVQSGNETTAATPAAENVAKTKVTELVHPTPPKRDPEAAVKPMSTVAKTKVTELVHPTPPKRDPEAAVKPMSTEVVDQVTSELAPDNDFEPVTDQREPLIAYMIGVTSRGSKPNELHTGHQAAFKHAIPSLVKTAVKGYQYVVVMGYDVGDVFYDSVEGLGEVKSWFKKNVAAVLDLRGIKCGLLGVKVNNVVKKPGPVFNQMAKQAYKMGAQWFYRLNDDTELTAPWVTQFIGQLKQFGPPYGVVGPKHSGGHTGILTHDFVHRTHMEIFDQVYYPKGLVDWWMDDWATHVYGPSRTKQIMSATAVHHTHHQGTRYKVNQSNKGKLRPALISGKRSIAKYMQKHELAGFEV